ncbi:coiled-coil domain-containing protein 15 [Salarias fasciatus]|uniref:Coiled-coil domain containing 15 n=1 Tax=Salarias fasciatus TaxID=181472 RepID=A0A672HL22_SALFA|nr:coiled-coil domain-containing protein 15 [Salarias fasciatus]
MTSSRVKASVHRVKEPRHPPPRPRPRSRSSRVLADRNPAVAAVGAWVEEGADFLQHPTVMALETEKLLEEKRRENEESLQRFQNGVRHRLAQRARVCSETQPLLRDRAATPDRRTPQSRFEVWTHSESAAEALTSAAHPRMKERNPQESAAGMRQVRLRLAARRVMPHEDAASNLPGGEWRVTPTQHKTEEEDDDDGDDDVLFSPHVCPLVQQKASGYSVWETETSQPAGGLRSGPAVPPVLWPLTGQEELKRQRQAQFLKHRRLVMTSEREQVKENKQQRKHLQRTARIKAEKERDRLAEERRLEAARLLDEARQRLQERELLVLERLRLEEEERAQELQRRKRQEKGKVATRFVEALRARMKERLSHSGLELPPLCCCASSFWDSHPDTCANNCVFHNNPRAYAQALHSTLVSLELQ